MCWNVWARVTQFHRILQMHGMHVINSVIFQQLTGLHIFSPSEMLHSLLWQSINLFFCLTILPTEIPLPLTKWTWHRAHYRKKHRLSKNKFFLVRSFESYFNVVMLIPSSIYKTKSAADGNYRNEPTVLLRSNHKKSRLLPWKHSTHSTNA